MAWGFQGGYGFSQRLPPPRRLTIEELLAQYQQPEMPEAPEPINSVRDLPQVERRRARMQSLFAGMAALGAGLQSGNFSRGAEGGMQNIAAIEADALGAANARQQADYRQKVQQAGVEAQMAQHRQQAEAIYGMFEKVTENEDPESAFVKRAELAAREGSMAKLAEQLNEKPQREAARARGLNPDAWDTLETMNAELKAEIERRKAAADWESEKGRLTERQKLENDAKLELERQQKAEGLDNYYQAPAQFEPLSRIAARERLVQSIRAQFAEKNGSVPGAIKARLGQAPNGLWGLIEPPNEENPKGKFTPIDGQPVKEGKLTKFMYNGEPYIMNEARPELGAIPMKVYGEGDEKAPSLNELRIGGGRTPPPAVAAAATRRLAAVKDAATVKKIQDARAAGYSDSEIAAFLGLH